MASSKSPTGLQNSPSKLLDTLDARLATTLSASPASLTSANTASTSTPFRDRHMSSQPPPSSMSGVDGQHEPTEQKVSNKRLPDVAFVEPLDTSSMHNAARSPKKMKYAPHDERRDISQVKREMSPSLDSIPPASNENIQKRVFDMEEYLREIKAKLNLLMQKDMKTEEDYDDIAMLQSELEAWADNKDKVHSELTSSAHVHDGPKVEPSISAPVSMQPVASGSNVRLSSTRSTPEPPFPMPGELLSDRDESSSDWDGIPDYSEASMPPPSGTSDDEASIQPPSGTSDDERFDEDGNFYGRGRDKFQGPVANADDIKQFLIAAGNSEQFDGNVNVDNAVQKLGLKGLYEPLPGMEVALMPHQAIGVAWMLEKEKSVTKGGCMADEMGLGKTVQMIAVMVANRSDDPAYKTNLIVAPTALLDQWKLEIEMKTNCNLKCLIYHGSTKVKRLQDMRKYDIVLTTFQTMAHEWPDDEEAERNQKKRKNNANKWIVDDDSDGPVKHRKRRKEMGLLFRMEWYRIILDEAQNVRNRRTRVSRAVTKLNSTYRWCLTGTPIINGVSDAYGLLRFLRIRPWYDWTEFNGHVARLEKRNPALATTRLQAIFATTLIRRKKDSLLDGKHLIELPPKEIVLVKLKFTQEELDIYRMVEARSQAIFNKYLRAGTVLKNYHQVLVLLLRLRQVCSHPSLIQERSEAFIEPEEPHDARYELKRATELVSADFVRRMKEKFKQIALQRMAAEQESADTAIEDEECPICFDAFSEAVITPCAHTFCKECIRHVISSAHYEDAGGQIRYKANERACPVCRGPISDDKLFPRDAFEPSDEELGLAIPSDSIIDLSSDTDGDDDLYKGGMVASNSKGKLRILPKRGNGRVARYVTSSDEEPDVVDDDDMSDFIVQSDEEEEAKDARRAAKIRLNKGKGRARAIVMDSDDEDVICGAKPDVPQDPEQVKMMPQFLPSTKMKNMMESLRLWAKDHPDEKTLIISQWTQCLSLISDYLTENGFLHVKYQGDMNRVKRDQAVRVFMSKEKATIMLMSLKCGGVGLNLTRANRVISLDLGWSEAVESQAFDRVHRLGQNRSVFVHRLVIENTVEDRVLALQERKKNLADGSLGEGTGKKLGRLSVKELANLFGLDHRGRLLDSDP